MDLLLEVDVLLFLKLFDLLLLVDEDSADESLLVGLSLPSSLSEAALPTFVISELLWTLVSFLLLCPGLLPSTAFVSKCLSPGSLMSERDVDKTASATSAFGLLK